MKPFILAGVCLLTLNFSPIANSHSGGHPTRFVAEDGVDQGDCESFIRPCKTISYAVSKSNKGDSVRLASGTYNLEGMDVFYILNDMIPVSGGYSREAKYKTQSYENNPTNLIGVPLEYQKRMKEQGFRVVQDLKGESNIAPEYVKMLERYKVVTTTPKKNIACENGNAGDYECNNISLLSQLPLSSMSLNPTGGNDIWGYQDLNNQREYAIMGLTNGTIFVDVTDPANPVEVDSIAGQTSNWRDLKVYQHLDSATNSYKIYAYITTEAMGGFQVVDLTNAPTSISLVNTVNVFSSAHNVYLGNIDYATGLANPGEEPYLYIAGSNLGSGLQDGSFRVFDLADPVNPKLVSESGSAHYMHDATSMTITDGRTSQCVSGQSPCELLIDFSSDRSINRISVDIWDTTDKSNPSLLSSTTYPNASYIHSGWYSKDKNYIFVQDEIDERNHGINTTMYVMDIQNLKSPSIVGSYVGPTKAIDHNGFTKGDKYYISNYKRGLTVLDVSNPPTPIEIGFFDTFPIPATNDATYDGAWGTYPYLPSGNIIVSDRANGLFVLSDETKLASESVGNIGLATTSSSVNEATTTVNIAVSRQAGTKGEVSVAYTTQDGSATAGSDYTASSGTLTWADGDATDKTISVSILDDTAQESSENFTVELSNPTGGSSLNNSTYTITINSNDQPAPPQPEPDNGGGGGGPMMPLTLAGLLGFLYLRRNRS